MWPKEMTSGICGPPCKHQSFQPAWVKINNAFDPVLAPRLHVAPWFKQHHVKQQRGEGAFSSSALLPATTSPTPGCCHSHLADGETYEEGSCLLTAMLKNTLLIKRGSGRAFQYWEARTLFLQAHLPEEWCGSRWRKEGGPSFSLPEAKTGWGAPLAVLQHSPCAHTGASSMWGQRKSNGRSPQALPVQLCSSAVCG